MALCIPKIDTKYFQKIYKVVMAVVGYFVPLLLIFLCYLGVIRAMSKNVRNVATSANKINKQRSLEAKKRVTKVVVLVVRLYLFLKLISTAHMAEWIQSVRLWSCRLRFDSQSSQTNDCKILGVQH